MDKLVLFHLDDDAFELERVSKALDNNRLEFSFEVKSILDKETFLTTLNKTQPEPDIILLDIFIDDCFDTGVQICKLARKRFPQCTIVMYSTLDDVPTISRCLNEGADDFISKNIESDELALRLSNTYRLCALKNGAIPKLSSQIPTHEAPDIVGKTMEQIATRIPRILSSAITAVHVSGESGVGKEVVADLFASHLPKNVPFIRVNCGAITPSLLESELFGHVKGSFTGAGHDRVGLLENANGGWIFLDEVATLSMSAQTALLRAIENQEVIRVGDNKPRPIKVRFLSATNENLSGRVEEGSFRKDLWQRLCETEIALPPLRERPDEIEVLVDHFSKTMPGGPYSIAQPAKDVLTSIPWEQGNIRELRNCLRAMTELHVNKH